MLYVSSDQIPGRTITDVLGLVNGNTVMSRHIGSNFLAGLKTIVGGEISQYTKLLQDSRNEAVQRMLAEAKALNADAVVAVRVATSEVMQGCCEIYVYGTAVKLA